MPVDETTDTGNASGGTLDGKALPIDNIFDPERLAKQGLSLDADEDDEEEDEDEEESQETDEEDSGEDEEEEEEDPEDDVQGLLSKYKTPESLAKALRNAQSMIGKQSNEIGTLRQDREAAIELMKRMETGKPQTSETEEEEDDSPFPKDEFGLPNPPQEYWTSQYLPELKRWYYDQHINNGADDAEARALATADALEKMHLERDKWESEYRQKRSAAERSSQASLEAYIEQNRPKQEETIRVELDKVSRQAARMGADPEETKRQVSDIAAEMVKNAIEAGRLSIAQASMPEVAEQAIWEAMTYLTRNDLLIVPQDGKKASPRPHAGEGRGTSAAPVPVARTRETAKAETYSRAHLDLAKAMGIDPKVMADKYGKI